MSTELGVGLALRAVKERVQQSVARRPRVRTGRRGAGAGGETGRHPRGMIRCHRDAEGGSLREELGPAGLARFPQRPGLGTRGFLEVGWVGGKEESAHFRESDSCPGVSPLCRFPSPRY